MLVLLTPAVYKTPADHDTFSCFFIFLYFLFSFSTRLFFIFITVSLAVSLGNHLASSSNIIHCISIHLGRIDSALLHLSVLSAGQMLLSFSVVSGEK